VEVIDNPHTPTINPVLLIILAFAIIGNVHHLRCLCCFGKLRKILLKND
jgi:hypothetical protein